MSSTLLSIKTGDRVRIVNWDSRFLRVETVKRITPTQIITSLRYNRDHGRRVGSGSFTSKIERKATREECVAWDFQLEKDRAAKEAKNQAETKRIEKTAEIQKLFRYCQITSEYAADGGLLFRLEWDGLTESEVRSLAKEEYIPRGTEPSS